MAKTSKSTSKATKARSNAQETRPRGRPRKHEQVKASSTTTERLSEPRPAAARLPAPVELDVRHHRASEASGYHADDEHVLSPEEERRFSVQYGHGRALEDAQLPTPRTTGTKPSLDKKRKASPSLQSPSPKKVRFDGNPDETREIQDDKVVSLPLTPPKTPSPRARIFPDTIIADALPKNPTDHLMNAVVQTPRPLSISEISDLFLHLQEATSSFARTCFYGHYIRKVTDVPLHDLERQHPSLFLTMNYILDASTNAEGWKSFFTNDESRCMLVQGIIGEWLVQRVFKDSAFGLSPEGREQMKTDIDQAYLQFDSFLRAKKRAELVRYWTTANNWSSAKAYRQKASEGLAAELLTTLDPLLPLLQSNDKLDPSGDLAEMENDSWRSTVRDELAEIIGKASALNQSILRTGQDGTVIRMCPRFTFPGPKYSNLAPMRCINDHPSGAAHERARKSDDEELVVKMTVWPRVEAYVPYGVDIEQLGEIQNDLILAMLTAQEAERDAEGIETTDEDRNKGDARFRNNFCWDCVAPDTWDVMPKECWSWAIKKQEKNEMLSRSAEYRQPLYKLNRTAGRSGDDPDSSDSDESDTEPSTPRSPRPFPDGNEDDSESETDSESEFPRDQKMQAGPPRGNWITFYDCVTPHVVYCEWARPMVEYEKELKAQGFDIEGMRKELTARKINPDNLIVRQFRGLPATVKNARADVSSIRIKWEDAHLKLHNFYASHNFWIEWLSLFVAVYYFKGSIGSSPIGAVASAVSAHASDIAAKLTQHISSVLGVGGCAFVEFGKTVLSGLATAWNITDALLQKMVVDLDRTIERVTGQAPNLSEIEYEQVLAGPRKVLKDNFESFKYSSQVVIDGLAKVVPMPSTPVVDDVEKDLEITALLPEPIATMTTTATAAAVLSTSILAELNSFAHGSSFTEASAVPTTVASACVAEASDSTCALPSSGLLEGGNDWIQNTLERDDSDVSETSTEQPANSGSSSTSSLIQRLQQFLSGNPSVNIDGTTDGLAAGVDDVDVEAQPGSTTTTARITEDSSVVLPTPVRRVSSDTLVGPSSAGARQVTVRKTITTTMRRGAERRAGRR